MRIGHTSSRSKLNKILLRACLVVVIAGAGLLTGQMVRNLRDHGSLLGPGPELEVGAELPDVEVVTEDGSVASLGDLIGERGSVLLVLDPGCPGCLVLAASWQQAVDAGSIDNERVLAVVIGPTGPATSRGLNTSLNTSLRTASDLDARLPRRCGITSFPWQALVDGTGHIRAISSGANARVDLDLAFLVLGP